jgi:hypothetical protein
MNRFQAAWLAAPLLALSLLGCKAKPPDNTAPPPDPETMIRTNLASLSPEDKALAEQQKYCPVMPEIRLGEYGTPHKVMVQGEPVFVCCQSCVRPAREEPEKTRTQLKEFKDRAAAGTAH